MYKPVLNQSDVRIADRKTVYQGFYQVQKVKLQHRLFQGGWSKVLDRELVLRLPAVAVLMYDATTDQVVLIEQFRVGAMTHEEGPWQLEMVAGMIDTFETPEQVAVRECKEESGAIIDQNDLELVCKYLVSSGGSNETLAIYCAPVDASQVIGVHGLATEGEDIQVCVLERQALGQMLEQGKLTNAATIIAAQWLQQHYLRLQKQWSRV
ncbi:NUDIX domain-containing protein [Oceanospirillaceae bacterium]|jgi:ADP-ribose pyrophosphatase|nr:NUDIX domain-containing protein [Oceanospirillaceae bacterium]